MSANIGNEKRHTHEAAHGVHSMGTKGRGHTSHQLGKKVMREAMTLGDASAAGCTQAQITPGDPKPGNSFTNPGTGAGFISARQGYSVK